MCEFLTIPLLDTRELCVGICFSLRVDFCWLKLPKKIESHPRLRSWYEVVWYVDVFGGGESLVWASDLTAVVFRFHGCGPVSWVLKLFIRHSFHKVPSRMVSIAIVILTILSPLASNPPNFFPPPTSNQHLPGPRVGWGWKPPHLNTIRSKARSPLTSRKAK